MEKNIHANMRVLYKENGQWKVGTLQAGDALIDDRGLFLPIIDKDSYVDINDIDQDDPEKKLSIQIWDTCII